MQYDVDAPTWGTYLHVDLHAEEREDDVQHLLVVLLVVRVAAVRHRQQEVA